MNISSYTSSVFFMMIAMSDQAQNNLRKAMFRIALEIDLSAKITSWKPVRSPNNLTKLVSMIKKIESWN